MLSNTRVDSILTVLHFSIQQSYFKLTFVKYYCLGDAECSVASTSKPYMVGKLFSQGEFANMQYNIVNNKEICSCIKEIEGRKPDLLRHLLESTF